MVAGEVHLSPAVSRALQVLPLDRLKALRQRGATARPSPGLANSSQFECEFLPLSPVQQRLWLQAQLNGNSLWRRADLFLQGTVNANLLQECLIHVVERHEALRTRFVLSGDEILQAFTPAASCHVERIDLSRVPSGLREQQAEQLAQQHCSYAFDLHDGLLLRAYLLHLSDSGHVLRIVAHQLVCDSRSMEILLGEVSALYSSKERRHSPLLAELTQPYSSFIRWQRRRLQSPQMQVHLDYWKQHLRAAPRSLELPTDRPRPSLVGGQAERHVFDWPVQLGGDVRKLAESSGTSAASVLLSALQVVLSRWSRQQDLVIGLMSSWRGLAEFEGLIGAFESVLPIRAVLSDELTSNGLIAKVGEAEQHALAHAEAPFERLIAELRLPRDLSRMPLAQVALQVSDTCFEDIHLPGVTGRLQRFDSTAAGFDLVLRVFGANSRMSGSVEYPIELYDAATIERLSSQWMHVLEQMILRPAAQLRELRLLRPAERSSLLKRHEAAAHFPQTQCLHQLFELNAERNPRAIAVTFEKQRLTYGELNAEADRLAQRLRQAGVGPEVVVGLCLERSLQMVVAILGVLKAGGAYLPLDTSYPSERMNFMLRDAGAPVLLTSAGQRARFVDYTGTQILLDEEQVPTESQSLDAPLRSPRPDNLAYVIYTSGSTGQPKGVQISHACVARLLAATEAQFGFGPQDAWTLFHSYAFDFSVWEIWGALLYGGRLVVAPYWTSRKPEQFHELLCEQGVTVLNQTPSAFLQLMAADAKAQRKLSLRYVIFGGEALNVAELAPWFERHGDEPRLINMYGITETTVHVTYRPVLPCEAGGAVSPIGGPLRDLEVYVLDANLEPVPIGMPGELYVSGAGLARGYLDRPELTAQRFLADPFGGAGERMYRSGDLARWRTQGELEYLGRIDHQVKLRGFRMELGEIESAMLAHGAVSQAVVLVREFAPEDKRLVAYVVLRRRTARSSVDVVVNELRDRLKMRLPAYMVPAVIMPLERMPLTSNGKIDRGALPMPRSRPHSGDRLGPRSELEKALVEIWGQQLGVARVGVDDNFFDLGGDSWTALRSIARIQSVTGLEASLTLLFDAPTPALLAQAMLELNFAALSADVLAEATDSE